MAASLFTKSRSNAPATPAAAVLVLQPPRHMTIAPLLLSPGRYHVGSDPASDLVLDAAGVAAQHALLVVGPHGVGLKALDSRTWVNDFLVTETALRRGDRISVGPLTLTVRAATSDDLLALAAPVVNSVEDVPGEVSRSTEATLARAQADRAAVDCVEIPPTPRAIEVVAPADPVPPVSETAEVAEIVAPAVVIEPVSSAPLVDVLAERHVAWQRERIEQDRQLVEMKSHLTALITELEVREGRLRVAESRLSERQTVLDQQQAEAAAARTTLSEVESALVQERRRLETVATQSRTAATDALDQREIRLHALEARLIASEAALNQRQAEAEAARIALDQREAKLAEEGLHLETVIQQSRSVWAAELEKRETRLQALETRLKESEVALDRRQAEIEAAGRALDQREAKLAQERLLRETSAQQSRLERNAELEACEAKLLALEARLIESEAALDRRHAETEAALIALEEREAALAQERLRREADAQQAWTARTAELEEREVWLHALEARLTESETALEQLYAEAEAAHTALNQREESLVQERARLEADARQARLAKSTELDQREARLAESLALFDQQRAEAEAVRTALDQREAALAQERLRVEKARAALTEESAAKRAAFDQREKALAEERRRLENVAAQARAELTAETEKQKAAWAEWDAAQRKMAAGLDDQYAAAEEAETQIAATKAKLAAEQQAWEAERREWDARREQQQLELAEWENEAQELRAELTQQRALVEAQRAELDAESGQRAAAHRELAESRQEMQRERRLFAEQQAAWIAEREAEWDALRDRRRRMDADEREIAELHREARESLAKAQQQDAIVTPPPFTEMSPSLTAVSEQVRDADDVEFAWNDLHLESGEIPLAEEPLEAVVEHGSPEAVDEIGTHPGPVVGEESAVDVIAATDAVSDVHSNWSAEPLASTVQQPDFAPTVVDEATVLADVMATSAWMQSHLTEDEPPLIETTSGAEFTAGGMVEASPYEQDYAAGLLHGDRSMGAESIEPGPMWSPHLTGSIFPDSDFTASREWPSDSPALPGGSMGMDTSPWGAASHESFIPQPFPSSMFTGGGSTFFPGEPVGESTRHEVSEPTEAGAEDTTEGSTADDDLRAKLAQMFGLPQDFGDRGPTAEDIPTAESQEVVAKAEPTSPARVVEEVKPVSATKSEDKPVPESGKDWRSQVMERLSEPDAEPLRKPAATFTSPAVAPARPERTAPMPTPSAAEEDSIASYMERMLARNRMGGTSDAPAKEAEPSPAKPQIEAAPVATRPDSTADSDIKTVLAEPLELRPRLDKHEERAALQSFRQVANLSARSALAEHSLKEVRGEILVQGILSGLATLAAGAYFCGPLWGAPMQPLLGTACLGAAGWMGWQISRSMNRLRNWNPDDTLSSDEAYPADMTTVEFVDDAATRTDPVSEEQ